jgi:hypothetical protein
MYRLGFVTLLSRNRRLFRALNDVVTGRTKKPTAQTVTATNVLQFLIRQAPNL